MGLNHVTMLTIYQELLTGRHKFISGHYKNLEGNADHFITICIQYKLWLLQSPQLLGTTGVFAQIIDQLHQFRECFHCFIFSLPQDCTGLTDP